MTSRALISKIHCTPLVNQKRVESSVYCIIIEITNQLTFLGVSCVVDSLVAWNSFTETSAGICSEQNVKSTFNRNTKISLVCKLKRESVE